MLFIDWPSREAWLLILVAGTVEVVIGRAGEILGVMIVTIRQRI